MNEYPLTQLFVIKQKRKDEAEKILNEKRSILAKEQKKLDYLEEEKKKIDLHKEEKLEQFRSVFDAGTTSDKIDQMKQYLKLVEEKRQKAQENVKQQKKILEQCEKEVEEARLNLLQKLKEIEKLTLHRKEWEKEVKYLETQEEGRLNDEMGSTLHHLKKKKHR